MDPKDETAQFIKKILESNEPNVMQLVFEEVKAHHKNFVALMQNINDTSLGHNDFILRAQEACKQFGYNHYFIPAYMPGKTIILS